MSKKKQKKKYYAIKRGKGVKDIIVKSWDECKALVLGYDSKYKSFPTEEEAIAYLEGREITYKQIEVAIKPSEEIQVEKPKSRVPKNKMEVRAVVSKEMYADLEEKCKKVNLSMEMVVNFALSSYLY